MTRSVQALRAATSGRVVLGAGVLLVGTATPAYGGSPKGISVSGVETSVLRNCLRDETCAGNVKGRAADVLRMAGMAGEAAAIGISPSITRGDGFVVELAAQTLPGFTPPAGVDLVPAIPRVGFGGVGGRSLRYGGGLEAGGAVPQDGIDLGYAAGARGGFALASPNERQWVGFELDAGYALVQGVLFDQPEREALTLGADPDLPSCPYPCNDTVNLVHVGLDSVLALDVDPTAVFFVRMGGVVQYQTLDVALDHTVWAYTGFTPRFTFGGAYRFDSHLLIGAALRFGLTEPRPLQRAAQFPWTSTVTASWRFGADAPTPLLDGGPPVPAPVPVSAAPAPKPIPRIIVVEHAELQCAEGTLPTGSPPPHGNEGWCATVDDATNRIVMDGNYVKWYDADHIEQRGQYHLDDRVGTWVHYSLDGSVDTVGDYADGLMNGTWRTYYANGSAKSEMHFASGRQSGESVDWGPDGRTTVVGQWLNGQRDGVWREYVGPDLVNERTYREGLLTTEQRY